MKNRIMRCLAVLLAVASSTAAAAGANTCRDHAQAAWDAMTRGDYTQVGAYFSADVAAHVTPAILEQTWRQLQSSKGGFDHLGRMEPHTRQGRTLMMTPVTFADGTVLAAEVGCNDEGRITQFLLAPSSTLPAASGTASKPVSDAGHESPVAVDGVVSHDVTVASPLGPLPGQLVLPAGAGSFPAVLLVAGSGPSDMDETIHGNKPLRDIASGLAKSGIASLRYDKRTHVYPSGSAAGLASVDAEVTDDALTAFELLAGSRHVDHKHVFVLGHSLGGMMAPRIAKRDADVAGLILMGAPARPMLAVIAEQVRVLGPRMGRNAAQMAAAEKKISEERRLLDAAGNGAVPEGTYGGAPQAYWASLHAYHQVEVAKTLDVPMLVLQGGKDFQVFPGNDFGCWKRALGDRADVTFHLYPGLNHLFMTAGETGTTADYKTPGHVDPKPVADIGRWIHARSR